ncbi:MAG: hypothetical protein V4654_15560 [Bdellovibrionota bacterium]
MKSSRILKALTLTLALTAASNAFAATATEMLSEDLQAGIKTLSRETRMYHYFGINLNGKRLEDTNLKKAGKRNEMVQTRVKQAAAQFWDLNNNTTQLANAGIGLYLAIDPYASSPAAAPDTGANFGSTMLEVTFNAGTRYLDLMKDVPLRDATIQAIISETGMSQAQAGKLLLPRTEPSGKVSHKGFARDTLQYMAEAQNTNFRKMVYNVYSQNGIAMTEYGWQAATSAFCGSTTAHRSALVYVGGPLTQNAIKSVTMVFWEPNSAELDAQESEALGRNRKFFSVLQPLRPLEKKYQSTADQAYSAKKAGDKATAKQLSAELPVIMSNIKTTISSVYSDEAEINDLRSKTFECLK